MVKAKGRRLAFGRPIVPGRLQKRVGAGHVGLNKGRRTINRTINMGLCGKMHNGVGLMGLEDTLHLFAITDIHLLEGITGILINLSQGLEITGIFLRLFDLTDQAQRPLRV